MGVTALVIVRIASCLRSHPRIETFHDMEETTE